MILKQKKSLLVVFLILAFLGFTFFLILNNKRLSKEEDSVIALPTESLIPTVDSSVKVDFKTLKRGEVAITISNEPKGTKEIDFELVYKALNSSFQEKEEAFVEQGAIGKCYQFKTFWQCGEEDGYGGRKIVLGTCSSGVCRYHNISGPIKLNLRFTGKYGEKIYQGEFKI